MHAITAIRSQGRFGRGQGQEYTEAYVVEYWRQGFTKWERWKNTQNKEVGTSIHIIIPYLNIEVVKYIVLINSLREWGEWCSERKFMELLKSNEFMLFIFLLKFQLITTNSI